MSVIGQMYRLQVVDAEWDEVSGRLAEAQASLGETEELRQARQQVADIQDRLGQFQKQMRELELETGGLDAKLKANQERLYGGRVRNPKELSGLQDEAAALRRRCSDLEDRQLDLMMTLESGEAELAESQARLRQVEEEWQAEQARLRAVEERLKEHLVDLEEQRAGMRDQISPADLALYDELRSRLGNNSIAALHSGICQVCGVDVPATMVRAVERNQGLNYCPICNRLLYAGG